MDEAISRRTAEEIFHSSQTNERSMMDRMKNAGAVALFAFQQSPGNEAIRGFLGANIFESTNDPLLVGVGVGAATLAIEGLSSLGIAAALSDERGLLSRLKRNVKRRAAKEHIDTPVKSSVLSDTAVMLGVGAGALVVKRHLEVEDSERCLSDDIKTSAKASSLIAGFSAGVAYLASAGVQYGSMIGLEKPAEFAVNTLADGRTYLGLMGVAAANGLIKRGWRKVREHKSISTTTQNQQSDDAKNVIQMGNINE